MILRRIAIDDRVAQAASAQATATAELHRQLANTGDDQPAGRTGSARRHPERGAHDDYCTDRYLIERRRVVPRRRLATRRQLVTTTPPRQLQATPAAGRPLRISTTDGQHAGLWEKLDDLVGR